jgi:hypothetical protein
VPLSQFVSAGGGETAVLHVRPEILAWLVGENARVEVSARSSTGVKDTVADSFDTVTGIVTFTPPVDADLVVVSGELRHDLPVVTHWNASRNLLDGFLGAPRGGQQVGASDGIGQLDYDPGSGALFGKDVDILNQDPTEGHAHLVAGPYAFSTHRWALFSDGTETTDAKDGEPADADVPGHERYIAENYALAAPTDLAAIWLSDRSREISGLPIAHKNHPEAFAAGGPAKRKLLPGLPIFQVVHCYVVPFEDPGVVGAEQSLATFIVPPGWVAAPATPYAVLFNSFYDIHSSTFGVMGAEFLRTLGELYALDGRQAVGILHNGGGASACQTIHASAYANAARLFSEAQSRLGIDTSRVVVTGGSRGGTSALGLSANPFADAYTATYILAVNPQTHPGEALHRFANPTYPLVQSGVAAGAGYKAAWKDGWTDPESGRSGAQEAGITYLGQHDGAAIDAELANGSPSFVAALAAKGSRVILRLGTHDHSKSFSHMTRYIEALQLAGVPTRAEIGYRFGHGAAVNTTPTERDLLNWTIDGVDPLETGIVHLHPETAQDEVDFQGTEFTPEHAPVFVESPLWTGLGQRHTHTFTGPPGALYELWAAPIDTLLWIHGVIVDSGPFLLAFAGALPDAPAGVEMTSDVVEFTPIYDLLAHGPWRTKLRYSLDGGVHWTIVEGETSSPPISYNPVVAGLAAIEHVAPVSFQVASDPFDSQVIGLEIDSRTGGLSEDSDL